MLDDGDQFYVEPEQEHVRPLYQLELPTPLYDKSTNSIQNQNTPLKIVQKPKEIKYQYKRFKFDKPPSSQSQQETETPQQSANTGFFSLYSSEQLVYKKYHNQSLSKYKNTQYFSGTFFHHNVFLSNQKTQSNNFTDFIKDFYDINPQKKLPQDQLTSSSTLIFDSQFQSGNLFAAFKVSDCQYDLMMEMDKNSAGNTQWFFFSVSNLQPLKQYTFNIINFTKNDSLFNYGMQPAFYSLIQAQRAKNVEQVWKRMGLEVSYKKGSLPREGRYRKFYYRLSFKIISKHPGDKLFIAHSYPYSFAKLNQFIQQKLLNHKDILQKITIGKTLSNRPIQCLKITIPMKKKDTRKAIIILARQHPGQTQGSFVCEGVIQKILSKSKEAQMLRKNYIFYVVPMVNPDGVVFGHYRTNLAGKDLNRKWDSSQKETICPQVICIKSFIAELSKQRQIRFILDLHGHSKKLNSFFYGNPCAQNPQVVRIYPYLCSKLTPAIQFQDCTFTSEEYKRKAARIYLSFLYKLLHVYTFEVSFYAYIKDGKKKQFTPKQYRQLGGKLVQGLAVQLEHEIKYQQSFQFNLNKNSLNKQYMDSPFVQYLLQLKQNKNLMEVGGQLTSGSESKPQEGEINEDDIQQVKKVDKLMKSFSIISKEEMRSAKISRKGQRDVKQVNRKTRNVRLLQINKINSVLPDKFQLCLQPIRKQPKILNQTLKTSVSTLLKQNSESQTQKHNQEMNFKQFKKSEIESCINLSNSFKINVKPQNSNEKRYSSVIKTQNRNNIIFKIDFGPQDTFRQKHNLQVKTTPKLFQLKHAFSQTMISFHSNTQRLRIDNRKQSFTEERFKNSQTFLPLVQTPQEKIWTRNNSIKYDTVRIGSKRQAEIYLNGVVKKYLVEKQQIKQEPLSIFAKVLERPKSVKKKQTRR